MHEAQEREVNSEQRVQDIDEELQATKVKLSDLQQQQKMITQEAVELREQSNNYINEIERLNGASELAIYRAVEKERSKWEEREARWLSECSRRDDRPAEATRSRPDMNECAGIPTSTYSGTSASSIAIASAPLSPVAMLTNLGWGKSGTGTGTGTGIFRVKAGRGRGQGRFLDGSWDQNEDHREGAKEYFSCSYSGHTAILL